MHKLIITFLVVFIGVGTIEAQRYRNPSQYLRQFNNHKRKADIKTLLYLEANLKAEDPRRVQKYQEIVLSQLKDSKKELARIGPYQEDDVLQREYVSGFEMMIDAFDKDFRRAGALGDSMNDSYESLKRYYSAMTEAEDHLYEASYKIDAAEDHFINTYYLEFERDQEIIDRFNKLDEATLHSRDMTLAFFRVEYQVQAMMDHINNKELDSIQDDIIDIKEAIGLSGGELKEYAEFEGEDDLIEELEDYLGDMLEEVNFNLIPLSEQLQNRYLDEKDYQSTQKDLQRFVDRHKGRVEDFYETRADFIEEYIPEE